MDWDTWFFEVWEQNPETAGTVPEHDDYTDWLYDRADLALGGRDEIA